MKKEKIKVFDTLFDQYQHMGVTPEFHGKESNFTIFRLQEVFRELPFSAETSRLNFFVFNFTKNGQGMYHIDDEQYAIRPGCFYFTNPGHYRSYTWTAIEDVTLITFSEAFLKQYVHPHIFDQFPFLLAENFPVRNMTEEAFAEFERIYTQIHKEYVSQSLYRNELIGHLFVVLLLKVKEYFWEDYNPINEGNRSSQIVKRFRRLLDGHYRDVSSGKAETVLHIQDYADDQNLHPNYLSTVIKTKTGKSIGTWIMEKNMAEAKSLLRHTELSIKEIAYRLGFNDPAHFSGYFKKNAGVTALAYRKGN
ncbi:helix-turn-helix domain-containing protein [Chitinophaga sp. GCM10012297]|uniref:AraC family transcriptional regulator n=1 Tax=Chitinophaga chungangae TaxID=2821488 RepID=A0ABS3YAS1_9BACT|nr:AraC family transcriptional regulator [Chitinophaga chungangae]MBO9151741.1 AraC family transcriptional regulator [Chitinophaga chungangae]